MKYPFQALIFDLDGVLVDSGAAVETYWRLWAQKNNLDPDHVIHTAHGRRTVDTIALLAPSLDAQKETEKIIENEASGTEGLKIFPGAKPLLLSLPDSSWAVATSGSRLTATTRLNFAELPIPEVLITADDVTRGKPHPEAYALASERLGIHPDHCIVIEDSPAGIQSAKEAGMNVVAVLTTHAEHQLNNADLIVRSIASLSVNHKNGENYLMARGSKPKG